MTAIEWTDTTWNPTTGCDQISPGCDNCYALTMAKRLKLMGSAKYQNDGDTRTSGPGFALTAHPDTLRTPMGWGKPRKVFVNSMSDLFHSDVNERFIGSVWDTMALCDRHTFQVLTKRPQRMAEVLGRWAADGWTWRRDDMMWCGPVAGPLRNVWLGTSIESDRYAWRANHLRNTPAAIRFLSLEPLLGPLPSLDLSGIGWVIVGGESGPGARPMHPDWVRDIRDRCVTAGVPFLFKQWGAWAPECKGYSLYAPNQVGRLLPMRNVSPGVYQTCRLADAEYFRAVHDESTSTRMEHATKKSNGRELDGRTWDEYPAVQR